MEVHQDTPSTGLHILVVDDNEDSAESLAKLLQMFGHQVQTAYDGSTALEMIGRSRPDVVLLDIGLPDIDGYEVARRVRLTAGLESVVLITLSGNAEEDTGRRSHDAGFSHHLTKPVRFQVLQALLASLPSAAAHGAREDRPGQTQS